MRLGAHHFLSHTEWITLGTGWESLQVVCGRSRDHLLVAALSREAVPLLVRFRNAEPKRLQMLSKSPANLAVVPADDRVADTRFAVATRRTGEPAGAQAVELWRQWREDTRAHGREARLTP